MTKGEIIKALHRVTECLAVHPEGPEVAMAGARRLIGELAAGVGESELSESQGYLPAYIPPSAKPWDGLPPGSKITIELPVVTREQEAIERERTKREVGRLIRPFDGPL